MNYENKSGRFWHSYPLCFFKKGDKTLFDSEKRVLKSFSAPSFSCISAIITNMILLKKTHLIFFLKLSTIIPRIKYQQIVKWS